MRIIKRSLCVALAVFFSMTGRSVASDWPEWVNSVVNLPTPVNAAGAPAVVLLDDTSWAIDNKGVATEVHRYAVRILHISGRNNAISRTPYNGTADKVLDADAWLIRAGTLVHPIKSADWVDVATNAEGAAIDEYRSRQVSRSNDALANDVFAYETRVRRPLLVAQLHWLESSDLPVVMERLTLSLPAGFSIDHKVFGPKPPTLTTAANNTWIWTSADRPYRKSEPFADPVSRIDADILINLVAPAGSSGFTPRIFSSWGEVTKMYETINAGQCDSSPELAAKVRSLIADQPDLLGKIKALGGYVQKIRYIEINQGLRYGFGWKARKASAVFSNGYGDCKDKANLLAAMLNEAGIHSHRVIAMIDPDFGFTAHSEWPSPVQFNHAIIGIEVDDTVQLPAVVATDATGRLLFFDPTDPYTLVGDLPHLLQGTYVHVASPETKSLIRLPEFDAKDDFVLERRMNLQVALTGAVTATGRVEASGQTGAIFRHEFETASLPKDIDQLVSNQLSEGFRGAVIQEKKTDNNLSTGRSTLTFACSHPRFGQRIAGNGVIVKLDVLNRRYLPNFSDNTRTSPIALKPIMVRDEILLKLAAGQSIDEVPGKISIESPYGNYQASFEMQDGALVMKRMVTINRQQVPAEDYAKLRHFLSDIAKADRSSVLLKQAAG